MNGSLVMGNMEGLHRMAYEYDVAPGAPSLLEREWLMFGGSMGMTCFEGAHTMMPSAHRGRKGSADSIRGRHENRERQLSVDSAARSRRKSWLERMGYLEGAHRMGFIGRSADA